MISAWRTRLRLLLALTTGCVLDFPVAPNDAGTDGEDSSADQSVDRLTEDAPMLPDAADGGFNPDVATVPIDPPYVAFIDLESGPNSGGPDDQGTVLSIYGHRFGGARGNVRIGGVEVASILQWTDEKIAVSVGPVRTGEVIVQSSNGASADGPTFTVRPGRIRCVDSAAGSDAFEGTWGGCWQTLAFAFGSALPGDVIYAMPGSRFRAADDVAAGIEISGRVGEPIAFVGYPGEAVAVEGPADGWAWRVPNIAFPQLPSHWTVANLRLTGGFVAIEVRGEDWRWVGNTIECSETRFDVACADFRESARLEFLSNRVQLPSGPPSSYFGLRLMGSGRMRLERNEIVDGSTDASISIQTDGRIEFVANRLQDAQCLAAELVCGTLVASNNLIVGAGRGPAAGCMNVGAVDVQCTERCELANNTIVDAGNAGGAAVRLSGQARFDNNLLVQPAPPGRPFFDGTPELSGTTNLFEGGDTAPAGLTASVREPAMLDDAFVPAQTSPAVGAARGDAPMRDALGRARGRSPTIGAFERPPLD
ncbi:MAG: IPT/TIG domain-containing protein [Myxococcota bacterium]